MGYFCIFYFYVYTVYTEPTVGGYLLIFGVSVSIQRPYRASFCRKVTSLPELPNRRLPPTHTTDNAAVVVAPVDHVDGYCRGRAMLRGLRRLLNRVQHLRLYILRIIHT